MKRSISFGLLVAALAALPTLVGCQGTMVISSPDVDLGDFEVFGPQEKTSNPDAGEDEYIYLITGREGVRLEGPVIAGAEAPDLLVLDGEGIRATEDGFEVVVNSRLAYSVVIDGFEHEVDLARVEIKQNDESIGSEFVFVATGDGVAHDLQITALVDDAEVATTESVSIEAREQED